MTPSPLLTYINVWECPSFSNIALRQALFLPLWAVFSIVSVRICLFSRLRVRISRHVFVLLKVVNVSKFLTSYHIFLDRFGWITIFLRLNIVHVSCHLTYQVFWIKSRAGGSCLMCFFTFKQKLFKLSSFLLCFHAWTNHFHIVFFVQSFNSFCWNSKSTCSLIFSFFATCCLFGWVLR